MVRRRYRPTKLAALCSAVVGIGMLVFALANLRHNSVFMLVWCVVLVAVVGLNLWTAFSGFGSRYRQERSR